MILIDNHEHQEVEEEEYRELHGGRDDLGEDNEKERQRSRNNLLTKKLGKAKSMASLIIKSFTETILGTSTTLQAC